jgi:hypothetical protein
VLELGAGHGSTPLLHNFCVNQERELYTYESDQEWFQEFADLQSASHHLILIDKSEVGHPGVPDLDWGLVFVDHIANCQRQFNAEWAAGLKSEPAVVLHDFQPAAFFGCYHWDKIFGLFRFRWIYRRYCPHTAVLCQHQIPGMDRICGEKVFNCSGTGCSDYPRCSSFWASQPRDDREQFHQEQ